MTRYVLAFSSLVLFGLANAAAVAAQHSLLSRNGGDKAVGDKWKDYNDIASLMQKPDTETQLDLCPFIENKSGCVTYPAVDKEGYHGSGLQPTGRAAGDCNDLEQAGQVYARTGQSSNRTGTMYSYYLPKVEEGKIHKHHWMAAVVWYHKGRSCQETAENSVPIGISYLKEQGIFDTTTTETIWIDGNGGNRLKHPILQYDAKQVLGPVRTDEMVENLLSPMLVGWDGLPAAAREQLNGIVYEHTAVPFSDANFQTNMDAAHASSMLETVPPEVICSNATIQDDPTTLGPNSENGN
ncbi:necrosis inducing protein [Diaporthe helianthi]|uniref:Necrosis inducing protein n=1 Tax=Diaporthe helianthi TaxID=158607 RepID=A0A2P5I5V7_DIAHE|nr:necrosis inducing protein [Diaporthe helianthi]